MKIKDLIKQEIDVDIYEEVEDGIGIAFCGPVVLTAAGREYFKDVLEYDIDVDERYCCGTVHTDDPDEKVWKHKYRMAKEFFYAAAGYCSESDYNKWFEEM